MRNVARRTHGLDDVPALCVDVCMWPEDTKGSANVRCVDCVEVTFAL